MHPCIQRPYIGTDSHRAWAVARDRQPLDPATFHEAKCSSGQHLPLNTPKRCVSRNSSAWSNFHPVLDRHTASTFVPAQLCALVGLFDVLDHLSIPMLPLMTLLWLTLTPPPGAYGVKQETPGLISSDTRQHAQNNPFLRLLHACHW